MVCLYEHVWQKQEEVCGLKQKTITVRKKPTVRGNRVLKKHRGFAHDVTRKELEGNLGERAGQEANLSMTSGSSRAL